MIRTQLSAGALVRIRNGVYIGASNWPDDPKAQHLVMARAELVAYPGSVMSHESAAAWWGLPHPGFSEWHEASPSVFITGDNARYRPGPCVHHIGTLPHSQITRDEQGYDVTTVARTAVDLAAGRSLPDSLVLFDDAARKIIAGLIGDPRRRDFANPRFAKHAIELLEEAYLMRRPAGLATAIRLTNPARESVAESLSAGHIHLSGLPMPCFQTKIQSQIGALYPDFFWKEHKLVGEVDGKTKYLDPAEVVREKRREQILRDMGYLVVRWLASEIMLHPHLVIDRIARALGA